MAQGCDCCGDPVQGEIWYADGEILVGCADCILEIAADPARPIESIIDYSREGEA